MSEGTRTPDRLDHNQELYQLSYAHQARGSVAARGAGSADDRHGLLGDGLDRLDLLLLKLVACADDAEGAGAET